jgi:MFS family permease
MIACRPLSRSARQRWKAFALLVLAYFITIVDFTIVNVALPTIGRELRFPESDLPWMTASVTSLACACAGLSQRRPRPTGTSGPT